MREVCVEDSGGNGVDGDAEGGRLAREAFGKADDGGLGRGVVHGGGQSPDRSDGSDVEDRSLALANHLLIDGLGDGEQPVDVGIDDLVPGAVSGRGKIVAAIDGGVIDKDVYALPLLDKLARQSFQADAIGDGNFEGMCAPAVRPDLLADGFGQVVARVIVECHVRALAGEDFTQRRADAARTARDKCALSFKQKTHLSWFSKKARLDSARERARNSRSYSSSYGGLKPELGQSVKPGETGEGAQTRLASRSAGSSCAMTGAGMSAVISSTIWRVEFGMARPTVAARSAA